MNNIEEKTSLFTEITAEEAANINGGFWQPVANWIQEQAKKAAEKAAEEARKAYQAYLNYQKWSKRR